MAKGDITCPPRLGVDGHVYSLLAFVTCYVAHVLDEPADSRSSSNTRSTFKAMSLTYLQFLTFMTGQCATRAWT